MADFSLTSLYSDRYGQFGSPSNTTQQAVS